MFKSSDPEPEKVSDTEIGRQLRIGREAAGVSVAQLSETTRITKSHIKALEAGDFENLPGIAYTPGFIRSYCAQVGLDPAPLVKAFKDNMNPQTAKPVYRFPVQALVPKMAGSMIAMVMVVTMLAGYVGWAIIGEKEENPIQVAVIDDARPVDMGRFDQTETVGVDLIDETQTILTQNVQDNSVSEAERMLVETLLNSGSEPASADMQTSANQLSGPDGISKERELNTALSSAGSSAAVADKKPESTIEPLDKTVNGVGAIAVPRIPKEEIILVATSTSWVEITRADGEVVVSKLMKQGDRMVLEADDNLFLSSGNAGGVSLSMGERTNLVLGKVGEIIRDFSLDKDSLSATGLSDGL